MHAQLKSVNSYSTFLIVIGVVYLIYLTISIFIDNIKEPLPLLIAHGIEFSSYDGPESTTDKTWVTAAFKFTGFMSAICFLMLGTYISYYKSVVKVDAMVQVHRASVLFLTCYSVIGFIHSFFVIFFCISQDKTFTSDKPLQRDSVIIAISI